MTVFLTLIIPAEDIFFAPKIASSFDPGCDVMWETSLSSSAVNFVTHFIAMDLMGLKIIDILEGK